MKSLKHTANGKKPASGRRNPVVRELVQKPPRNAGRHKDRRDHALMKAMTLDNVQFV